MNYQINVVQTRVSSELFKKTESDHLKDRTERIINKNSVFNVMVAFKTIGNFNIPQRYSINKNQIYSFS